MNWNLETNSAKMTIAGVADATAFRQLLTEFADSILADLLSDEDHYLCSSLGGFLDDAVYTDDEAELLEMLVDYLEEFVSTMHMEGGATSVSFSGDNDSQNLLEALATFLLPYATEPYVVLFGASFHRSGGSYHQTLLYRSGDKVVAQSVSDLIQNIFANPTEQVGTLLPFVPVSTAENVLVPMTE